MSEYRVQIEIDVDVDDEVPVDQRHVEAAKQAWHLLHDPAAQPWVCDVFKRAELGRIDRDKFEKPVRVDLDEVLTPEEL